MYIDVWGPAKVASFGGRQYFINDYSHQVWVKGTADLKFDVRFRFVSLKVLIPINWLINPRIFM